MASRGVISRVSHPRSSGSGDPFQRTGKRRRHGAIGLVLVLGLILAACGSSGSGSDSTTDVTIKPSGPPKSGGSLVYGLEAESPGFNPTTGRFAISAMMVANAVYDPLAAYDADGVAQPYLVESMTPNADFTTWTITTRSGVTFSDGTPVDAAAIAGHLEKVKASVLTRATLSNVSAISVSSPTQVVVTTIEPWAAFPASLTAQIGYVPAPAYYAPGADERRPIGSGPFVQKEWIPDNRWVGDKNPNYWREDSSGNKLPYLDQIEFRPIIDPQSRLNSLISGDIQMMHTTDWPSIVALQNEAAAGNLQVVADPTDPEESFVMFNTTAAPVNDPKVRQSLALCTDPDAVLVINDTPLDRRATSQFTPDSEWYVDSGFVTNNVEEGTRLANEAKAAGASLEVSITTTPTTANKATVELLSQQWQRCGYTVTINTTQQDQLTSLAVTGQYQALLWRQFAAADPDGDYIWWTGENATGPLAINIARLQDSQIDAALKRARGTTDLATRKEAYAELQRRQSELVPYLWLAHGLWVEGAANNVRNLTNVTLPDGSPSAPFQAGAIRLVETWIDN